MCPFSLRSDGALSKEDVVSPFVSPEVVSCKPISALGFEHTVLRKNLLVSLCPND